ncbi:MULTISPECIES: beta-L-arabinofuranosidase domain-containing protein [unclassified Paenibacillus]|uniref:beta-L-arabinofuranosidase domain-containing protein n=1 Tax=unclassified Paenibacillus TaxID=185978 RepID=UPI000A617B72|nr:MULTISPECIES: beta-L-arabinofuranosidase domain-containing protein [unclassified Paenibacillus]
MMLKQPIFTPLPLGSIKPSGWIRNQLNIQADGLTGHLEEHWEDVGSDNGWLGGKGESWERGPYYVDGLLPLAYLLEDETLIRKAMKWVEWALSSQREDGMFGPNHITTVNNDVNKRHDWWHFTIMLKVLTQHQEASGDERVIPFLTRFFRYLDGVIEQMPLEGWAQARGADLMLSILWLHQRTNEEFLLQIADKIRKQTLDWPGIFNDFPFWRKYEGKFDHRTHVVNVAMALKTPALFYRLTGQEEHREAVYRGLESLMKYHGQAHGMFSGDEWLSGTHPSQGVELCAVVEYMFSLEHVASILGDGRFGDTLEKVAYNALPATISADWTSHQYDQQVNQVVCNVAKRNWVNRDDANTFGLAPNFGCCTANMHQGWPKLVSHLWMSTQDGGIAAVAYAPCFVRTTTGSGKQITAEVITDYPFKESIHIRLSLQGSETFPLYLRVPAWCQGAVLKINGSSQTFTTKDGYARIEREWGDGDEIDLSLPMEVKQSRRSNFAASVERGPLVYVLPITESWTCMRNRERFSDWEVYPASPWKYGLIDGTDTRITISEDEIPYQPYQASNAPVRVILKGQLLPNWGFDMHSAATPPMQPKLDPTQPVVDLELVPYGSARLRIGEFPVVQK